MNSRGIQIIVSTGAILFLGIIVFTSTNIGQNLAAVINSSSQATQKCAAEIGQGSVVSDYEITTTRINTDSEKDYILKGVTDKLCGSAGCIHQLCIVQKGEVTIVPFGYASEKLVVKDTITAGMHDLQLQGQSTTDLQWDGNRYVILQ